MVEVVTSIQILPGRWHHRLLTQAMSSSQSELLEGTIVQYTVRNVTCSHTELEGYAMTHLEAPDAPDIECDSNHRLLRSIMESECNDPESDADDASTTSTGLAYHGGQTVFQAYAWKRIMIDGTPVKFA